MYDEWYEEEAEREARERSEYSALLRLEAQEEAIRMGLDNHAYGRRLNGMHYDSLVIVGVGGVGSHAAVLAARTALADKLILIDHDVVEQKNVVRQAYTTLDVGKPKVEALRDILKAINPLLPVDVYAEKVDKITLKLLVPSAREGAESNNAALLLTDNVESKRELFPILARTSKTLLANCEEGFCEIKDHLDEEELNAWKVGDGYASTQTWESNMLAAVECVRLLAHGNWRYPLKSKIEIAEIPRS
jgi:hypothetical protein